MTDRIPYSMKSTTDMTMAGLNLIEQAISIFDSDLRLAVANRPMQEMFDLPNTLVSPGAPFDEVIRTLATRGEYGEIGDIEEFVKARVDLARAFEPHYMERTRANGRTISVEGHPLPEGGWVTVYTDITAIKEQEALLRARSETLSDQLLSHAEKLSQTNRELASTITRLEDTKSRLTEMEARTRLTTEMMPAHIAHVGPDRRYTFSNRRLGEIIPGRPSDIVGKPIKEVVGKAVWAQISEPLERAYAGDGSVFEFSDSDSGQRIRIAFTPDERAGDDAGVYLLSTDVTEEAQARAALAQTHKRELAAQLTSGLAHDFANLLTIILGLQAKLSQLETHSDAAELIAATKAAAKRGGNLLDRIAQMSGHREPRLAPTILSEFLNELRLLAGGSLPENIDINIDISACEEPLLLDRGFLQDTLLNLILNARDAMGVSGGVIKIHARPVRDTWIEIEVSDSGPGFTETALYQALEPFFTTKGEEGSGLGLSMAYDLTKSLGGQISLSNTGTGACVTLKIPLRKVPEEIDSRLVLLVEDNDDIRRSVREMLMGMGHTVIEATSAEEAMTLAQVQGIGLVLSDIRLKGDRNGVTLLDDLRRDHPDLVSCLMTSLPKNAAEYQAGAARYPVLSKPFNAGALRRFLEMKNSP